MASWSRSRFVASCCGSRLGYLQCCGFAGKIPVGVPRVCGFAVKIPAGTPQVCRFVVNIPVGLYIKFRGFAASQVSGVEIPSSRLGYLKFVVSRSRSRSGYLKFCGFVVKTGWDTSASRSRSRLGHLKFVASRSRSRLGYLKFCDPV